MALPASVAAAAAPGTLTFVDIRKKPDDRGIPGSLRYSGEQLEQAGQPPFEKTARVVLYCGSGNSSSRIAGELRNKGYNVDFLEGGYAAWTEAGLPTEPLAPLQDLDDAT